MKKLALIYLLLLLTISFCYGQSKEITFVNQNVKADYETEMGRFHGKYKSYYKNGQQKSEGTFENNLRTREWTVWDSLGNVRMKRVYSDPFTFERIIPTVPKDKPIQLLNIPRHKLDYNSDGYISYAYVMECDVHYHKRIWRFIPPRENHILFGKNRLYKILTKNIMDSTIKAYSPVDDEFTKEFLPNIDTNHKLIGFKLKEDFFFDMNRLVSESRIMGICPVLQNQAGDTIDAFWVYYPELRKIFAQYSLDSFETPQKIHNLDDLFFYRYFYGRVIKESAVYNRKRKANFSDHKESERIDIELIEKEHDIWISLTKAPK